MHLSFSASLAEEEVKTESDAVEGMEISTRSKGEKHRKLSCTSTYLCLCLQAVCGGGERLYFIAPMLSVGYCMYVSGTELNRTRYKMEANVLLLFISLSCLIAMATGFICCTV